MLVLYTFSSIQLFFFKWMRWAGHVDSERIGEMSNVRRILVGKCEGRLSRRWDENIKICLKIGCEVVGWIHLTQEMSQSHILTNTISNVKVQHFVLF
jgi:hypothetical protein